MSTATGGTAPTRRRAVTFLVLLALVAGVAIGAYGPVLLRRPGVGALPATAPTVTVTVTAQPPPPPPGTSRVTVDVPDSCLVIAQRGSTIAVKVNQAVDAARSLKFDEARRLLDEIQIENPQDLAANAERCRSALEARSATSAPPVPVP